MQGSPCHTTAPSILTWEKEPRESLASCPSGSGHPQWMAGDRVLWLVQGDPLPSSFSPCPFWQLCHGSLGCSHPVAREAERLKPSHHSPSQPPAVLVLEAGAPTFPASPAMWHHMPFPIWKTDGSHGVGRTGWGNGISGLGSWGNWAVGAGRSRGAWLEKLMSWAREHGGRSWGAGETGLGAWGNWAVRAGRTGLSN